MTQNKVSFGLSNVQIALLSDDGTKLNYETPFALPGAVELSLDPEGDSTPFYADNLLFHNMTTNNGYSGKLTIANVTDEFRLRVLGEKVDADGNQVEFSDAQSKPFGMTFQIEGDANATRHVLFNVTAKRPSLSSKTTEDKAEVQSNELTFTAAPDPYTKIPKMKNSNPESETYKNWFNQMPKYQVGGKN
ncbi:phage tail protein [Holzapfeliella sp. He02]|uniref:Phage tail protein n=1 Tax=Holzapfeliella saturejae TaxID=3082953 RepID=A0ABU8SHZ5_9LACO